MRQGNGQGIRSVAAGVVLGGGLIATLGVAKVGIAEIANDKCGTQQANISPIDSDHCDRLNGMKWDGATKALLGGGAAGAGALVLRRQRGISR